MCYASMDVYLHEQIGCIMRKHQQTHQQKHQRTYYASAKASAQASAIASAKHQADVLLMVLWADWLYHAKASAKT